MRRAYFPFLAFVAGIWPAAKAGKQQRGPAFIGMAQAMP